MSVFPWLKGRQRDPEVMDDPCLDADRHYAALRGLARLNGLSASVSIVWRPILQLAQRLNVDRLRILDVASGAGDIPLGLWTRAQQAHLQLEIQGVDVSPRAVEFARERVARHPASITFEQRDVLKDGLPEGYDAVISSLFFHHLESADVTALLRSMSRAARHQILVSDLRRNLPGLFLAHAASRLLTRSDVVRTDAPLSVKAAFTMAEISDLAKSAGLENITVSRRWPCRMLMAATPGEVSKHSTNQETGR